MCAHKIVHIGQFVVLSCSRPTGFTNDIEKAEDGSKDVVRKIKIYLLNGTLIESISVPRIDGYTPTADDDLAVQVVNGGIRVGYMVMNVGHLVEIKQYRSDVGIRVHINAFSTCKDATRLFSDGKVIYLQDQNELYKVKHSFDIDCNQIYVDNWTVLRKIVDC